MYTHNANLKHMGHLPVNPFHDMDHGLLLEMPFTWWMSQVWTLITEKSRKPYDMNFTLYYFKVSPSSKLLVTSHNTFVSGATLTMLVVCLWYKFSHMHWWKLIHIVPRNCFFWKNNWVGLWTSWLRIYLVPISH
jgi:hypothetical protein